MAHKYSPLFYPSSSFYPTEEQIEIQTSRDKTILIEANAGAAKTTTLAFRVGESLARGVVPHDILILTFTPEAQEVARQRLADIGIPRKVVQQIRVETFEEFSANTLYQWDGATPELLTSARDLKPHVLDAIGRAGKQAGYIDGEVEFAMHSLAISQFIDTQLSIKARMLPFRDFEGASLIDIANQTGIPLADWLVFNAYESLRCRGVGEAMFRGPFDATYDLAKRLEAEPENQSAMPSFRIVLCDELHDINEAAFRILANLLSNDRTYFVGAGDKDQVIYATLGADPQFLSRRFQEIVPSLVRFPLTATYRYGPQLALSVGHYKGKKSSSALGRPTTLSVLKYEPTHASHCADAVITAIESWEGSKRGRLAVLLRDRHQSIQIESVLIQRGQPYETPRMASFLLREEILFLRGLMAIALNDLAMVQSEAVRKSIIESMAIYCELDLVPTEEYPDPLRDMQNYLCVHLYPIQDFFTNRIMEATSALKHRVADAVGYLATLPTETKADIALREVCRILDLEALAKRLYVHAYDASIVTRSIDGFISLARQRDESVQAFVKWISQTESSMLARSRHKGPEITVDCIANVKGMEFDHVILPYLEVGQFPDPQCAKEQEENLFYVGITRAKHALTLLVPVEQRLRSSFVDRMNLDQSIRDGDEALDGFNVVQRTSRIDLDVPYDEKDLAKSLGARWDAVRRVWYIDADMDPKPLLRWLPKQRRDP